MGSNSASRNKPIVVITGAAGNIGSALIRALKNDYFIIGMDMRPTEKADDSYEFDLTSSESVQRVMNKIAVRYGRDLAAVVHLAAYFDFTGEESPAYQAVNVDGTRNLLKPLRGFNIDRFVYSSTMLVHEPGKTGQKITEQTPIKPTWIYPKSKADTEEVIREHAGKMPYSLLRLAGLYDEKTCVPILAHQIARIYEHNMKSHLYSGDIQAGQAYIHREDMIEAFRRTIDRRKKLPRQHEVLLGEEHCQSYESIQNRLGELIHGKEEWKTISVPMPVAKAGAWVEEHAEPVIPDAFDKGEKPFIRPFMIDRASDHYDLDISRAREQLGWVPKHRLFDELESLVASLKADPKGWHEANGITPPDWMEEAEERGANPDRILTRHDERYRREHHQYLWAHFANIALGAWLITSPPWLGYESTGMIYSDVIAGILLMVFGFISLSWRQGWARWVCASVGVWLLLAPLVFWTESAAAYLNGTIIGILAISFSALVRPAAGISPVAATTGPTTPPGWDNNPSSWFQRMPIILLAFIGFFASRYLAAYQLGHIDGVWEPFFAGTRGELNGTEDIITSEVSEAWPVPDAGLGAIVYALEILIGLIGAANRWRTMPWVVATFGIMIVPLALVSITFIIIQPIIIGAWCTLCLIMVAAMLLQIAFASNEFVATGQFLRRRHRAGAPVLKVFFTGDTDDGPTESTEESFDRNPLDILREAFTTGVNVPWNLALCVVIGAWLMLTRITLGNEGAMANWDHLIGSLVITLAVIAFAGSARPARLLMIPLTLILLITPFIYAVDAPAMISSIVCGLAIGLLALRRGPVPGRYGDWNRLIV